MVFRSRIEGVRIIEVDKVSWVIEAIIFEDQIHITFWLTVGISVAAAAVTFLLLCSYLLCLF